MLCTTKFDEFCVLDEFEANRKLISEGSLGKLIQSCLQDKVGALNVGNLLRHSNAQYCYFQSDS